MSYQQLAVQLFHRLKPQTRFIEQYYSDIFGRKMRIVLDERAKTSSCSLQTGTISIAVSNIVEMMYWARGLESATFYSLELHEIGHALYSPAFSEIFNTEEGARMLAASQTKARKRAQLTPQVVINALEDNRIEYNVERWNARTRFLVMRYTLQDTRVKPSNCTQNPLATLLALTRVVDNRKHKAVIGCTPERALKVAEIERYVEQYRALLGDARTDYTVLRSMAIFAELTYNAMFDLLEMEMPEEDEGDKGERADADEGEQDSDADEGDAPEDTDTDEQDKDADDTGEGEDDEQDKGERADADEGEQDSDADEGDTPEDTQDPMDKLMDDIKRTVETLKSENKTIRDSIEENIGILENPFPNRNPYERIPIEAFTTVRRMGIKGAGTRGVRSGSIREFSYKRYARRDFIEGEKLFLRSDMDMKGGQSATIVFYLDISGSMCNYGKIENAVLYLKSFYDVMHRLINIKIYAFGEHTYRITRNELDEGYLRPILEGSTKPQAIPLKPNEELVMVTDGDFHNLPVEYYKRANFVLIDGSPDNLIRNGATKVFAVDSKHLREGLDAATRGIKRLLQK